MLFQSIVRAISSLQQYRQRVEKPDRTEQRRNTLLGEQQIIWNTKPFLETNYMNQSLPRQHQAFNSEY